jgi:hypothetical protein
MHSTSWEVFMFTRRGWRPSRRRGGGGCGGCGCLLIVLALAVVWVMFMPLRAAVEQWIAAPTIPAALRSVVSEALRLGAGLRDSLLRLVPH